MTQVPNLKSNHFVLPASSDVLQLGADKHRTYLRLAKATGDVRVWVGNQTPPSDISNWLPVGDALILEGGVYGPVLIAERDSLLTDAFVLSSKNETAVMIPLIELTDTNTLTTSAGDELTTPSGDLLAYHVN